MDPESQHFYDTLDEELAKQMEEFEPWIKMFSDRGDMVRAQSVKLLREDHKDLGNLLQAIKTHHFKGYRNFSRRTEIAREERRSVQAESDHDKHTDSESEIVGEVATDVDDVSRLIEKFVRLNLGEN